jgi:signal transduction histidine kinase
VAGIALAGVAWLWTSARTVADTRSPMTVPSIPAAAASPVPEDGSHEAYVDARNVGSVAGDGWRTSAALGATARQIPDGSRPREFPVKHGGVAPIVEGQSRADAAGLPPGAEDPVQETTVWETYGTWMAVATAAEAVQLLLIAGLIARRATWRRTDSAVKSREQRLKADASRMRLLAGRLIHAQEATRAAIARDLHDDICQELFGVAVAVSSIGEGPCGPQAQQAMSRLHEVVSKVRRLAHDLHPPTLQLLGLNHALRAYCMDFEQRHDVQVDFQEAGRIEGITPDVSVCLFRIAQEALRNGSVHGGARRFEVALTRLREHIELVVTDDGGGFDVEAERRCSTGIGLLSMEQRAQLTGGHTEIGSRPGHGSRIRVRIPAEWDSPGPTRSSVPAAVSPAGVQLRDQEAL